MRVWEGATRDLPLAPAGPIRLTARKDEIPALSYSILLQVPVVAPVMRGQKLGDIVYTADGAEVTRVPLLAAADTERAGVLRRLWDGTVLGLASALSGVEGALHATLDTFSPHGVSVGGYRNERKEGAVI